MSGDTSQGLNTLASAALKDGASGAEAQQAHQATTSGELVGGSSSKSLDGTSVGTTKSNPQTLQHFTMTNNNQESSAAPPKSSSAETQNWQQQAVSQQNTYSTTPAGLAAFLSAQNPMSSNMNNVASSSTDANTPLLHHLAYINLLQQNQSTATAPQLLNTVSNPLGFDTNAAMSLVVAAQQAQQRGGEIMFSETGTADSQQQQSQNQSNVLSQQQQQSQIRTILGASPSSSIPSTTPIASSASASGPTQVTSSNATANNSATVESQNIQQQTSVHHPYLTQRPVATIDATGHVVKKARSESISSMPTTNKSIEPVQAQFAVETATTSTTNAVLGAEDKKQQKRAANRRSAQLSRKRKKQFIEQLQEENDGLRRKEQILLSIPDLIAVFDSGGKLNFVSRSVSQFLSYTPKELEGTSFWDRLCDESVRLLKAAFMDALAARNNNAETTPLGSGVWEVRLRDKDGTQLLVTLNGVVHFSGEAPECVCSIRPRDETKSSTNNGQQVEVKTDATNQQSNETNENSNATNVHDTKKATLASSDLVGQAIEPHQSVVASRPSIASNNQQDLVNRRVIPPRPVQQNGRAVAISETDSSAASILSETTSDQG